MQFHFGRNLANAPHCDIEATGPIIRVVRMNGE